MKYITNETINHFKKYTSRLYKKVEEGLLNKKKKREETKQKSKIEKNKLNNPNPNQYNYYPGMYMPPMQINNQNPAYYNEYQNIIYMNPPPQPYQMNPQMFNPYMAQSFIMQPKTMEDCLEMIYSRGIVNNIIAAFFIKECQEKQKNIETRKVPVSTVELAEEQEGNNFSKNREENNINDIEPKVDKGNNDLEKKDEEKDEDKKEEENEKQNVKEEKKEDKKDNELKLPSMV